MLGPEATLHMNPAIAFPLTPQALKISAPSAEKWAAALREERRRLMEDQESLREREQNLRDYESRLRSLQDEIEAGRAIAASSLLGSNSPFVKGTSPRAPRREEPSLPAAWDKLHRARELLEAEQDHLRNDRNFLREHEHSLQHRENAVAAREARVAEREAMLEAGIKPRASVESRDAEESAVSRLTRVPFDMARSMLGGKK